jgi:L-rhamnonate dehydratase
LIITNVRTCQPIAGNSPPDWRTSLGQILVAIETDSGLAGYGVGGGGPAGMHVIRTVLRELLVRRPVEPVEQRWQEMYDATLSFGRKGIAVMAISGVDLALWDVRGKSAGGPIVELLGGEAGQEIATYSTVWNEVDAATAAGRQAVKLHVHPSDPDAVSVRAASSRARFIDEIVQRTEAAREVIGPDRELMIDAWMEWDVEMTLAVAERIAPLNIGWIEEPISADDLEGYRALRDQCAIPIAGGEHEFTAVGFRPLIEERLHQVLQPDVCWCGGMTELVKIYEMAREANLRVVPHRGAELWGLPAVAALSAEPLAESGRPWMTWVGGQPETREGRIRVGDAPGFGVEIDEGDLLGVSPGL